MVLKVVLQVDRLDDLLVFHQSFVTKEPVNQLCPTQMAYWAKIMSLS